MTSMLTDYANILKSKQKETKTTVSQDSLRTHVKAYAPKGKLLEPDSFSLSRDLESAKFFVDGINGKGNDYSIGRINDIAIKLGGIGIAAIIATSKASPLRKTMEFIGLGTWLAAMHWWPKLAINKPIKYLKGVDLDLEYQNSAGQKKKFYQDPQFMCWDLISDEEINKMGDKLGVPRNIENRRKAIENKARQVAVQGNTLALLTAGFATPLIASLVADKIDKKVLLNFAPVVNDVRAEKMAQRLADEINKDVVNPDTIEFIKSKVTKDMSGTVKEEIKTALQAKTEDITLRRTIASTVDRIFQERGNLSSTIATTEDFHVGLANIIDEKNVTAELVESLKKLSQNHNLVLNRENIGLYLDDMEEFLLDKTKYDLEDIREKVMPRIKKFLSSQKAVVAKSPDEISEQLIQMSKMIDLYDKKVYRDFENGFFKLIGTGEGSVNAKLWRQMGSDIAKALKISNKNLEDIVKDITKVNGDGKIIDRTAILSNIFEDVIADTSKLNSTIRNLGEIAQKVSTQNEKYVLFSLDYIDQMQRALDQTIKGGNLDQFSQTLKVLLSIQRQNVLKNYIGNNETAFSPIRVLNSLKQAKEMATTIASEKGIPADEVFESLKQAILRGQTTDYFINKLDVFGNIVKDEKDFRKVADIIFANLSDEIKASLPAELAEKIDANNNLQKHLLVNLTDDVKLEFLKPNSEEAINSLRRMGLYKYADELFDIRFNDPDKIINAIAAVARGNDEKLAELRTILRLSPEDIAAIKAGNLDSLHAICKGSWDKGSGFFESGRHRLKSILNYLGLDDLANISTISVLKSRDTKVANLVGQDLYSFVKTNAPETLNYNRWFKRVGVAFLALCGVTAFAISQLGKRNEFNPDIYKKRKSA